MRTCCLFCLLLGSLAWGQAAPVASPPAQVPQTPPAAAPSDASGSVAPDAAVITVKGVCPPESKATAASAKAAKPATAKTPADCRTVITREEFEKLASGVAPSLTPQLKKQLASVLPRFIAMSEAAKKKGLDKTPQYAETLKFAKMQILTNTLQRNIQEEAAKVPPADIESYYKSNPGSFEQFNLERLFVPRAKQQIEPETKDDEDEKNEKLTDEQRKAKQEAEKAKMAEGEQAMSKLADDLHTRAAAGEDFVKLQKEAFDAAGMKIDSPTVSLPKVRRAGLPAAHVAVFELKPGEISAVINDAGGHYIYKLVSKDQLTSDQAKDEIRSKLQNDRSREMMEKLNSSYKVETNEAYFGPGGPAMPPGPRGVGGVIGGKMAPGAKPPMGQQQAPPASQAPATTPAAKQD